MKTKEQTEKGERKRQAEKGQGEGTRRVGARGELGAEQTPVRSRRLVLGQHRWRKGHPPVCGASESGRGG